MEFITYVYIAVGIGLLIGFLWIMAKFFLRLLKHAIIASILAAVVMFFWYQGYKPGVNPSIGKAAYAVSNGDYLGTIIAEGNDDRMGAVWVIKSPLGYDRKKSKSTVTVKDK
jgi:hypothetical protein